jgi:hypothetical protein
VVVLMMGDLLVRVRGMHTPSPTTPYAHFSRPMLFCYYFSFLSLCYVVILVACHGIF